MERAWFRLPNAIFHSLTLLQPVYVKNRRWYLNKLEQYNHTRLCRAELIQIKQAQSTPLSDTYFVSAPGEFLGNWADLLPPITQEYLVFNSGQIDQTIDMTLQGGTGVGEWSIDFAQFILEPGESDTVTLSFNGSVTLGNRSVELLFVSASAFETLRPALVGVVTNIAYTVTPLLVDWGVEAGNNVTQDTIIENTGLVDIEFDLSAITGDTGNFGFVAPTPGGLFTLSPGFSQIIRINFSKQGGTGIKTGQFIVEPTTPGADDTTVDLIINSV